MGILSPACSSMRLAVAVAIGGCALTMALFSPETSCAEDVDLYAVVVGVSKYQDPENDLKLAAKDARDFFELLRDQRPQFRQVYVALLLDDQATRVNIIRAIREKLRRAGPEDIVIIYLAGHGCADRLQPDEYYFWPHDVRQDNLFGTAILMNDPRLYRNIKSERLLLLADSCMSGGYLSGLVTSGNPAQPSFPGFRDVKGRFGIAAAAADERAIEPPIFGNGLFTFFLLKGLRGDARTSSRGIITVQELFSYVAGKMREATLGRQNPQLFCAQGTAEKTPVYLVPQYSQALNIKVEYFYEDVNGDAMPLSNDEALASGQHVGLAFRADADCYVHVFWWDSRGKVGRLYPNPRLTEGSGMVKAGQTYWLPSRAEGKHWYVLDDNPGYETIYFVATREPNEKLEGLYEELHRLSESTESRSRRAEVSGRLEREINLMGFADYLEPQTRAKTPFKSPEELFREMENKIRVCGADAVHRLRFKHDAGSK